LYRSPLANLVLVVRLFQGLGHVAETFSHNCLKSLADLRDSHNFAHTTELEYTVGKAVRTLGPEPVLKAIPLQLIGPESSCQLNRTWLLPVLKENIQAAPLQLFTQYFLPIASTCKYEFKFFLYLVDLSTGLSYL